MDSFFMRILKNKSLKKSKIFADIKKDGLPPAWSFRPAGFCIFDAIIPSFFRNFHDSKVSKKLVASISIVLIALNGTIKLF